MHKVLAVYQGRENTCTGGYQALVLQPDQDKKDLHREGDKFT